MPAATVQYRYRIYSTDDTSVERTFDADLQGWDAVGGQEVRPLDGRTETRAWEIRVVDYSTGVTNDLADSSGRLRRLGRLAEFQQNLDSSGWVTLVTGRISDVFLNEDVASYTFIHEDEHYKARQTLIFNSTTHDPTCYVYPPGLRSNWLGLPARRIGNARIFARSQNVTYLRFESTASVSLATLRELEQDLVDPVQTYQKNALVGNYKFLRFRGGGADYQVFSLGVTQDGVELQGLLQQAPEDMVPFAVGVVDPTTALGISGVITGAYLYSPGLPPTPKQPWHIGSSGGVHPFTVLKDIYDSSYGDTAIRYDSTAMNTMIGNRVIPLVGYRITSPRGMGEFTEGAIYGAFGAVGFVSRAGRIMPRSLFMPSTNDVDPTGLTRLTGANLRAPHPTWEHTRRELVTVLDIPGFTAHALTDREVVQRGYDVPADLIVIPGNLPVAEVPGVEPFFQPTGRPAYAEPIEHDRLAIGRITHRINNEAVTNNWAWRQALAQEIFQRYGDGPVFGRLSMLSSGTSGILVGDFLRVNLETYPNMGIQGRGSTRIVQALSVQDTPYGPEIDYLDAGYDQTPLTAPTVTGSSSTEGRPTDHHQLNVTIGNVPANGACLVQVARDTTGGRPSTDSSAWYYPPGRGTVSSSGSYTVGKLPNTGDFWLRAKALKVGFWSSPWAYSTATKGTNSLVAPSGVLSSGVTAVSANISWSNNAFSTGYPLQAAYNATGSTSYVVQANLPPGTSRYKMALSSGTTAYTAAVRYYDPFGGFSNFSASTAFGSTGQPTADAIGALSLVYGLDTTAEVY